MRFDDTLETVLSADMSSSFGAQSAWRQLVDLIGRRKAEPTPAAIARLRSIRGDVPPPVRAASARALELASPPAALVRLFLEDELPISLPLLTSARLSGEEWVALIPVMSPPARSVLRNRRDLSPDVRRALESYGATDLVLTTDMAAPVEEIVQPEPQTETVPEMAAPEAAPVLENDVEAEDDAADGDIPFFLPPRALTMGFGAAPDESAAPAIEPVADSLPETIVPEPDFVSLGEAAMSLPVVAEAMRVAAEETPAESEAPVAAEPAPEPETPASIYPIADLVARLDAYQRHRDEHEPPLPFVEPHFHEAGRSIPVDTFEFETDPAGAIRWVAGVSREPLVGLALDLAAPDAASGVDGVAAGAFRRRAPFSDARLQVGGRSDAAGDWRISATPVFEATTGRFSGYRGTARRPHTHEQAKPARPRDPQADALRQLVHELRTPTNAIAGFAEMIESEMLGPVASIYRERAHVIRSDVARLIEAIDDVDMAARIDGDMLDLRMDRVSIGKAIGDHVTDLRALSELRGAAFAAAVSPDLMVAADAHALDRLLGRLMATLLSATHRGEVIGVRGRREGEAAVIEFDRPDALPSAEEAISALDAETETAEGAPLLGTGFALRLARNVARELGGALSIAEGGLTLRLPAAVDHGVEQASI